MPTAVQLACSAARLSSRRAMKTYPIPLSNAASGSSRESAVGASLRLATWAPTNNRMRAARKGQMLAGSEALRPRLANA